MLQSHISAFLGLSVWRCLSNRQPDLTVTDSRQLRSLCLESCPFTAENGCSPIWRIDKPMRQTTPDRCEYPCFQTGGTPRQGLIGQAKAHLPPGRYHHCQAEKRAPKNPLFFPAESGSQLQPLPVVKQNNHPLSQGLATRYRLHCAPSRQLNPDPRMVIIVFSRGTS